MIKLRPDMPFGYWVWTGGDGICYIYGKTIVSEDMIRMVFKRVVSPWPNLQPIKDAAT